MLLLWLPVNGMQLSKWTKYLHRDVFIYNGFFTLMWILQAGFQGWAEQVSTRSRAVLVRSDVAAQWLEVTATASPVNIQVKFSHFIDQRYGRNWLIKKDYFLQRAGAFMKG